MSPTHPLSHHLRPLFSFSLHSNMVSHLSSQCFLFDFRSLAFLVKPRSLQINPDNSKAYKTKLATTKEIFETVQLYTSPFNQRSVWAFEKWCSTYSVSSLKAKRARNSNSREGQLYILGDTCYASYVRKSPSDVDLETRSKLLQKMVDDLLDRSLVDKVYVSVSSLTSSPFNERDLKD
ncbi:hypothetical protein PHYBLDRAFT_150896 [Phycomyces blakesleeanus NRRL 1555(-)]|uniref:Uncharacterized protein n=2 Tax=Phycomyces blakesleeanus TaxID=4837 RepID=A0A167KD68_PHYB8|nr:hypothetical protein PHYBLDRAFT_150896 [Phycomyces blakesleeanus NRRL 1555(-)]OAD67807.1 hypothetical protein PHYBLDRAFT_150896 [Phycomyces blakesleeanus NRRL 1555(-)]|eukprot:XP_018285847.1 hypothetical protein PHYBLDRAFT_150896 [Phycomyces blakesleeanus NRRL 1555(-)]